LHQQRRGAFVVVGQAAVGEPAPIAGIDEQLRALDREAGLPTAVRARMVVA
jgi:hypothetical protein